MRFARYIANGVISCDTVAGYLSTIKRLHELGGFEFPKTVYLLKHQIAALRRELAHIIKKAPPITLQILGQIHRIVDMRNEVEVVAYAALVVGFVLFLRKSNLVPDSMEF